MRRDEGGLPQLIGRGAWVLTSQVCSSLTNMLLGIAALRYSDPTEFGSYAAAFLVFQIAISLSRSSVSEPFLILAARPGGPSVADIRDAGAAARAVGAVVGIFAISVGVIASGHLVGPFIVVGLSLPGVVLQDYARMALVGLGVPRFSAGSDFMWLIVQCAAFALLIASGHVSVVELMGAWGVAGLVAGLWAYGRARKGSERHRGLARSWWAEHRTLSGQLTLELILSSGGQYTAFGLVGVLGGLVALGAVRAAFLIAAPVQLFFQATQAFAIPEMGRAREVGIRAFRRAVVVLAAVLAIVVVAWLLIVRAVPDRIGIKIFAEGWRLAQPLVAAIAVFMLGESVVVACRVVLRVLRRSDRSLWARAFMSPLVVLGSGAGATVLGAQGAMWGLAAAQFVGAGAWCWQIRRLPEWTGRRPHIEGSAR